MESGVKAGRYGLPNFTAANAPVASSNLCTPGTSDTEQAVKKEYYMRRKHRLFITKKVPVRFERRNKFYNYFSTEVLLGRVCIQKFQIKNSDIFLYT